MQLIKYAELTQTPWKNGGGITRDMAGASVGSNHIWRLSMADVTCDGPFSDFTGFVRILTVIKGHGMALESQDDVLQADPWVPVRFDGATHVSARLKSDASTNLNLMFNPDYCEGNVVILQGPHHEPLKKSSTSRDLFLHCLSGTLSINSDTTLYPGDTARLNSLDYEIYLKEGNAAALITIDLKTLSA